MDSCNIIKESAIEYPSGGGGIGVSITARKYWRDYFASVDAMLGRNDEINYLIAMDYSKSQLVYRFILNSGEPAEIRKSNSFYYVSAIRSNGKHDVITMQSSYKEPRTKADVIKKLRLSEDWVKGVLSGEIKRIKKQL